VHLPEYADRIIDADPYGVLTYGDAASLSRSNCAHLMRALGCLSQTDPWFRWRQTDGSLQSGQWDTPAIGSLSRADNLVLACQDIHRLGGRHGSTDDGGDRPREVVRV